MYTVHSSNNETTNSGIPILDDIINNKHFQILLKPNVHNAFEAIPKNFENLKILEVKIPKLKKNLVL